MVYLSFPTEYGTLYTKDELLAIKAICQTYQIPLFIDGARLGYGLKAADCDLTLPELAQLADVFYIGGTKVGALCGEAVVFTKGNTPRHFITQIKQHGALLAKGRVLGIQFDTLFTDNLYFEMSQNAIERADEIRILLKERKYTFFIETTTNQIFVIVENQKLSQLQEQVRVGFWENYDESHTVIRFATSWATTKEQVQQLAEIL